MKFYEDVLNKLIRMGRSVYFFFTYILLSWKKKFLEVQHTHGSVP